MSIKNKKNIIVVCHDAGGAEIISSYVNYYKDINNFFCCVDGPAVKIFKRKKIKFKKFDLKIIQKIFSSGGKIDFVLAGTSWGSSLELKVINLAKKFDIKTAVYLDHWINYRERFNFPAKSWEKNLPDEIWAGDKYALALAKIFFNKTKVKFVANRYFLEIKKKYREILKKNKAPKSMLFISEPLTVKINPYAKKKEGASEIILLEKIIVCLAKNNIRQKIIIRNHPSENRNKYQAIVNKYSRLIDISISKNTDLLDDIAGSSMMIGFGSMALVIGRLCGKKVVSYLPDKKLKLPLPFRGIFKIKKANEILLYLNS